MTLFFQNNNGIWYGGKYINSCFKPKEELEESKRVIQTSGNLLQSYRDLFRPIFRHQHSTLIKYPLVQQTDKVDFNYFNKHLSAREKKFEHFPQNNFGIGKNHDSYYSTKFFLPNYKVLINPFFSRMNMPPKLGESQTFDNNIGGTLSNRRPFNPEMKLKGTRESQYDYNGVKKRKPIHKRKKDKFDKLICPHKAIGGLLLPSKIVLDNFNSWRWKNKKEIQSNNLSMSMVYDLLLPKSTEHKPFKEVDMCCCTTKTRKTNICCEPSECQRIFLARKMLPTLPTLPTSTPTDEYCEKDILRSGKFRNNMLSCVSGCACITNYNDQMSNFDCFTPPLAITTEEPILFKFEDYLCECYSCPSNAYLSNNLRKVNGNKCKRKKLKEKAKAKSLKEKVAEINLKFDNGCNNLQGRNKDKGHLIGTNDGLNIAKYIIISNDGVIDPDDEEACNYGFENISSFNTDFPNLNERSTDISRIKRRTLRCKSKWDCIKKRAFIPLQTYNYLFRKPKAYFFSSSSTSYLKNRNLKIRKMNKHKNRQFEKKLKNMIHKGLKLEVSNREVTIKQKPKQIGVNVGNKKNKVHKKRAFVGESQSLNSTELCDGFEEISVNPPDSVCGDFEEIPTCMCPLDFSPDFSPDFSLKTTCIIIDTEKFTHSTFVVSDTEKSTHSTFVVSDTEKSTHSTFVVSDTEKSTHSTLVVSNTAKSTHSTFVVSDTEKPSHSTFVKSPPILSKATRLISIDKSTPFDLLNVEGSTEIMEMPTDIGPKFRPDTGNRHPAKLKCEQQYNRECVCSVSKVLEEIDNMIYNNQDQKSLLNQLAKYNCAHYSPVEINYKMSPELKPRLISNKHKELLADETNGPKEIVDETFQELLIRDVPNEESDFYIFPSTSVEIPCFINNDVQLSPNTADSASYVWRQGDNKIITGGRVTEDLNHRGMLQIAEATIADSDNYTCTVNYTNPDTGQTVSDSFVHSVMVVTLPKFALHTHLHYTAKAKCDQETLEMFELYLPQQVEDNICYIEPDRRKICTVEIYDPICHPKNNELQNVDLKSVWKFRSKGIKQNAVASQENEENIMELSLNFELDIADVTRTMIAASNKTRCGPFCQLKITLNLVDILRESFTIVLPHPVSSSVGAIFKPDVNSINMKILIACEGGFKLVQGFCMPCPANTFSEEGSTECSKCLSGTYQPNIGSRTCEKCPHPFRTGCSSLWFSPVVIAVTFLIILLTVLISTVLVYLCKHCLAHCMSICISPCILRIFRRKKEKIQKQIFPRKILKKRIRKLSPRKRKEDSTEPPTPPAEDFTS